MNKLFLLLALFVSSNLWANPEYELLGKKVVARVEDRLSSFLKEKGIKVRDMRFTRSKEFSEVRDLVKEYDADSVEMKYEILTEKGSTLVFTYWVSYEFNSGRSTYYDNEGNSSVNEDLSTVTVSSRYFVRYLNGLISDIPVKNAATQVTIGNVETEDVLYTIQKLHR